MIAEKLLMGRARHVVTVLSLCVIVLASLFFWHFFVFSAYLARQKNAKQGAVWVNKLKPASANPINPTLLKTSWLNNPYQTGDALRKFSLGLVKRFQGGPVLRFKQQKSVVTFGYQGRPATLLALLWYRTLPAAYLQFSDMTIQCPQPSDCQMHFSIRPASERSDRVMKAAALRRLNNYFEATLGSPAKLTNLSVFQLHVLSYVSHAGHLSAIVGNEARQALVHLGDYVGAEHVEIKSIFPHRIVVIYRALGNQQTLSFS
jgi:hypothetical protein